MRKTFTYLSLLIAFMFAGTMKGWAQFKAELTTDPVEGYVAGYVAFDPAVIAEALETDTATLHAAIAASGNYYLATADGRTNAYTGNAALNEFWLDNDANPVAYNSGNTWFTGIEYYPAGTDPETGDTWSDSIYISFGQTPNTFKYIYTPTVLKATTYLVVGEKEISFEIIQNINAAPEPTLPDPVTKLSELTIVGEWTLELQFYLGKSYEGLTYSTTLDGIYEALGTTSAELDASAADYVYTQPVVEEALLDGDGNPTGEVAYSLSDDLVYPSTTDGWYGRYINYDETTATETPLPLNGPKGWGEDCTFYTQGMTLAEGEYSIVSGQYPGTYTSVEESDSTYHYLIVGDKAAKIKIVSKLMELPSLPLTEMTQVGEETIEVEHYIGGSAGQFTLDLANLEALLGAGAINFEVLADESATDLSSNTTANNGGYWLTKGGYPISWSGDGSSGNAIYVEPATVGDFSAFNYGFIDALWTLGEKAAIKLYFHNGSQYYIVNLNVTIIEQPQISEDEFENVSTEGLVVQLIPSETDYAIGTTDLDIAYITENLGEGTYKLYGLTAPKEATDSTAAVPSIMTDAYSCTPYPGFWMVADGNDAYVSTYNASSYGMTYANGVITWYNVPASRVAGDEFNSTFYLVNTNNNKMITYETIVRFVDAVVETEVVGEEDLTLMIKESDEPTYYGVDIEKVATAFGVDADLLLNTAEFKILKSATSYTADNMDAYGWALDENGYSVDLSDDDALMVSPASLGYEFDYVDADDVTHPLALFTVSPLLVTPADGQIIKTKLAVEYDAKLYVFNISIMNEETFTGVEDIEVAGSAAAGNVFDISGRLVRKAATSVNGLANGIYILNGKKYIVK